MKTIFLSFLGTNDYVECIYDFSDKLQYQTRFTQSAIISRHKNEINEYLFFLTKAAKAKNWDGKGNLYEELKEIIGSENCIKVFDIPDGYNNDHLKDIFKKLINAVEYGSKLIIDVTHSFRSLPINLSAALNYLKITKNISIQYIYYGAFEILGPTNVVKEKPIKKRIAPLLDITYLSLIQDWSVAINNFLKFGNIDFLKELSQNSIKPILKETKGRDEMASAIRDVIIILDKLLAYLYTCRSKEILYEIDFKRLKELLNKIVDNSEQTIFPQLIEPFLKIKQKLENFSDSKNDLLNVIKLVDWCISYNWIQQGYTILQENIASYILQQLGESYDELENRKYLSYAINVYYRDIPEQAWEGNKMKIKSYVNQLKNNIKYSEIARLYFELTEPRNDINHGGYKSNPRKPERLKSTLKEIYEKVKNYFSLIV